MDTSTKSLVKCNICHNKFGSNYNLRQHLKTIHGGIKDRCNICDREVRTSELNTHISNNHGNATSYTCDICEKSFPRKDGLKSHFLDIHTRQKNYKCEICGSYFYSQDYLKKHTGFVHNLSEKLKCHECGKWYASKRRLTHHYQTVHENVEKLKYKCEICAKYLSSLSQFRNHMAHVHDRLKPFQCTKCDKQERNFPQISHLYLSFSTFSCTV